MSSEHKTPTSTPTLGHPVHSKAFFLKHYERKSAQSTQWEVGLCEAPFKHPVMCVTNCVCMPCQIYEQRRDTSEQASSQFRIFDLGCSPDSCCGCVDSIFLCPKMPCMCLEAFCCPMCSIFAVRHRMYYRWHTSDSVCDGLALCAMLVSGCLGQEQAFSVCNCLSCLCVALMLTQHEVEMLKHQPKREILFKAAPARVEMPSNGELEQKVKTGDVAIRHNPSY